ncbi:hypothetical protein R9C00_19950 [Flammeovirgaceae bacterium SG7u.111]|nr:hypothetical protein [Flammeovirgaceae bacterium SG7u.132]WPO33974.1 hypothetical protein R9C00_19950 [Flammeovirgaceae bacterium SG7u.111]
MKFQSRFKLLLLVPCIAVLLFIQACGEEDAISKKEILVNNDWNMTEFEVEISVSLAGVPLPTKETLDLIAELDECDRDDLFDFMEDNTFIVKPNLNLCVDGDDEDEGNWFFSENETKFNLEIDDLEFEIGVDELDDDLEFNLNDLKIDQLTSSSFKLSKSDDVTTTYNGVEVTAKLSVNLTLKPE